MEGENRKRVIVVGAGLSGLSAARQLLTTFPEIELTVLEALDRVGGRTHTVDINGFAFDEGAEFIGDSQKYALELAKQSGNELENQFHQGTKVIHMQNKAYRYQSDIPSNLNVLLLIELQLTIWKINRMAAKVSTLSPKDCQLGYQWDAISAQTWLNQNVRSQKLKTMIELAFRSIFGAEPCQMSFLYMLWYVHQSRDFDNLINVRGGLQQKKTKLGTQHMSKYLAGVIQDKKGRIELNVFVKRLEQRGEMCYIVDEKDKVYECDYVIMACSPWQVNKIDFVPPLSMDRKLLCERSFMGSYIKVILLYKRAYWKEKGMSGELLTDCFDSPLMTAFDDTKHNQNGQTQPALIVFVGGYMYRVWKDREDFQQALVNKIAEVLDEPEMRRPVKVQWKAWQDEKSIGGGPTGIFPPGVLSQVDDLRRPQGDIHWAGTEMATVSTGYMDGAIESGLRAAKEVEEKLKGSPKEEDRKQELKNGFWYTKYLRTARKWVQWL